jgi:predicted metal-dependent enzyme (double-stranded beta helix superfamily)
MEALIRRLDDVVRSGDDESRCRQVKQLLANAMATRAITLDPEWLRPATDRYARRLLHLDPARRYSVLAMVWDQGQGTALHDHGGTWCVECVYQGRIEVTSYSIRGGDPESGVVQFAPERTVIAGVGEAGALIPPFEYHLLRNATSLPAVTLHVYGGELNACHIFEPVEGGWRRRYRELAYTQ